MLVDTIPQLVCYSFEHKLLLGIFGFVAVFSKLAFTFILLLFLVVAIPYIYVLFYWIDDPERTATYGFQFYWGFLYRNLKCHLSLSW